MPKYPRAESSYNRRESVATLTTPDKTITVFLKLTRTGDLIIAVHNDKNERIAQRELSKSQKWDD